MGGIVRVCSDVCICELIHARLMPHSLAWLYKYLDDLDDDLCLLCMRCPCNVICVCLWTHVLMEVDLLEHAHAILDAHGTWLFVQAQSLRTMNPAAEKSEIPLCQIRNWDFPCDPK